jgi:hypothetical protein
MSARRTQRNTRNSATSKKRHGRLLEGLESRILFNTIITDNDPLTLAPATDSFEYKDFSGGTVRVIVHGDVSAEFIFARVTKGGENSKEPWNDVILGEPVGPLTVDKEGKTVFTTELGRDLFNIYVAQASIDSYISIARVANPPSDSPRPMIPFDGGVTLTINQLRTTARTITTTGGSIYLGARTRAIPNVDNSGDIPIRSDNFNGMGIAPKPANGRLVAGLTTAPGVSLGKFMFGGTVSGQVTIQGSMETFYCGALLTGVTEGQDFEDEPEAVGNFYVAGDIRNILSKGSIGTNGVPSTFIGRVEPIYISGVDFNVLGRVGQIRTDDDYIAWGLIRNTNKGLGLRTRQQEIEVRIDPSIDRGSFTEFENGQFGDNQAFFNNDDFANAQFLGSINGKQTGTDSVQVNGVIEAFVRVNDTADYYAVPLMAGQKVGVRLIAPEIFTTFQNINGQLVQVTQETKSLLHAGVFDPDNRLIATDWSNTTDITSQSDDIDPAQQQLFMFTVEKPGIYRFAVGYEPSFGTTASRPGAMPYQLQITGVGNLALGGLVATNTIEAPSPFFGNTGTGSLTNLFGARANIETILGDLGALYSINDFIVSFGGGGLNAIAQGGDLRAVDAVSLGVVQAELSAELETFRFGDGANVLAYTGSVGMIRARGTDRTSNAAIINAVDSAAIVGSTLFPAIGGDIQWVVAPNTLITDLAANGNIGVVQTAQFGINTYPGSLSADADGRGKPGTIDLVDTTLNLGTIQSGGPIISAGPGGNVRYIHVAPGQTAFRPAIFGGNAPEETTFVQGQSATFTDDSGANVTITPSQDFLFNPVTAVETNNSGTLTVLTYPIAQSFTNAFGTGGGGVAIVRVTSTRGVQVTSDGATEIGDLQSTDFGPTFVVDPNEPNGPDGVAASGDEIYQLDANSTEDNSVTLRTTKGGRGLVDVWNLRGNNFNFIRNDTGGEIVNAQIGATDFVRATNLGLARSAFRPGMLVEGATVADLAGTSELEGSIFPYLQTKNAFTISGGSETSFAANDVTATQSIGNLMINGIVEKITANSDRAGVKGVFEGVVGAILTKGTIRLVDVGEGLLPSGTGRMGRAGIYGVSATPGSTDFGGRILRVVANDADIRGDIASNTAIGDVVVTNGSIINSDIWIFNTANPPAGTGADLQGTFEWGVSGFIPRDFGGNSGLGNIGSISVTGLGGIIGLNSTAANIGPISSNGGFGIVNSELEVLGAGRIGQITADGYGVRGLSVFGGQSVDGITAYGPGKRLATTGYSPGVRFSESLAIDPFFGTRPNALTDLHILLGTTAKSPQRKGVSNGGSIDFVQAGVSRDFGPVRANTVRASEFNVPNLFTSLTTNDYVDKVKIVTGRLPKLTVGRDALRLQVDSAGDIGAVYIGGAFRGSSGLRSNNGSLASFTTGTTLFGDIYAARGMGSIRVGSHFGSQGSRTAGSLREFITNGNLLTGSKFTVGKDVQRLVIGGDVEDGALFDINGTLGTKTVIGEEIGDIVVG